MSSAPKRRSDIGGTIVSSILDYPVEWYRCKSCVPLHLPINMNGLKQYICRFLALLALVSIVAVWLPTAYVVAIGQRVIEIYRDPKRWYNNDN